MFNIDIRYHVTPGESGMHTCRYKAVKEFCKRWLYPQFVFFWVNHSYKALVYSALELLSYSRRQSPCRYLKKSAAADGSPHNEYTNTETSLWVSYLIFHPLAFLFFSTVNQSKLGNNTYLLSGIWRCWCGNDRLFWLLTLEMWFLPLQCFTIALSLCFKPASMQKHNNATYTLGELWKQSSPNAVLLTFQRFCAQVEAIVKCVWTLCSSVDQVLLLRTGEE